MLFHLKERDIAQRRFEAVVTLDRRLRASASIKATRSDRTVATMLNDAARTCQDNAPCAPPLRASPRRGANQHGTGPSGWNIDGWSWSFGEQPFQRTLLEEQGPGVRPRPGAGGLRAINHAAGTPFIAPKAGALRYRQPK